MSCHICGTSHREKPCPTDYVVTTTTEDPLLCPPAPLCPDLLETHCVYYSGPDLPCADIYNGDDVNAIIQELLNQLANCCLPGTTTSTTTSTTTTSTTTTSTTTTTTLCPVNYLICCSSYNSRSLQIIEAPCDIPDLTFIRWEIYQDGTNTQSLGERYMWVVATQAEIVSLGYSGANISYVPNWNLVAWASAGFGSLQNSLLDCNSFIRPSSVCPEEIIPTTTTSTSTTTTTTTTIAPTTTTTTSTTSTTTSTTSTTSTTTTTTAAPEEFVMEATKLEQITFTRLQSLSSFVVDWGDGNVQSFAAGNYTGGSAISHTYATAYTGQIIIRAFNLTNITNFQINTGAISPSTVGNTTNPNSFTLYIIGSELVKLDGLLTLSLTEAVLITNATTLQLARTLTFIGINYANISGTIANLPNAAPVAKNAYVSLGLYNTVTGNLSTMPISYSRINIAGVNTISGNINTLKVHVTSFAVLGLNTLSGNIASIPSVSTGVLREFNVQGYNTLFGNIRSFNIQQMVLLSITGEENPATPGFGGNTISGTIDASLGDSRLWNTGLVIFQVLGKTSISGTLSTFQNCTSLIRIAIDGKTAGVFPTSGNTITGNLNTLPVGAPLNRLIINGNNTITGNLSNLTNYTVLQTAVFAGQNTISGDLSDLPKSIYNFNAEGNCTINAYSIQKEKANPMNRMAVIPANVAVNRLTSGQLEQLVIDLDDLVDTVGSRDWNKFEGVTSPSIALFGQWASPSGPAFAAFNSLVFKLGTQGGTITITDVP